MKKYKLIKTYPNSPALGTIISADKGTNIYFHKGFQICYPDKFTEFWEEVVEKDYEILKQEYVPGYCYHGNQNPNQYKIISIKRFSDGEVFTIGDNTNFGKIQGFNIKNSSKLIIEYYRKGNWQYLNSIKKVKQPLFISEDGVVMYEGDTFWYVCKSLEFTGIFESTRYANAPNTCYFSNKKDAEKYVLENKKSLSLKDVALVIGECNNTTYVDLELLTHKLKKIIKSEERK